MLRSMLLGIAALIPFILPGVLILYIFFYLCYIAYKDCKETRKNER